MIKKLCFPGIFYLVLWVKGMKALLCHFYEGFLRRFFIFVPFFLFSGNPGESVLYFRHSVRSLKKKCQSRGFSLLNCPIINRGEAKNSVKIYDFSWLNERSIEKKWNLLYPEMHKSKFQHAFTKASRGFFGPRQEVVALCEGMYSNGSPWCFCCCWAWAL